MNIRPFEIVLIGAFGIAGIVGLFFIANYEADNSVNQTLYGESIIIWGDLPSEVVNNAIFELSSDNKALSVVKYKEIDSRSFESTLLNAIADGNPPDLVILPHDLLVTYRSKLQPVSFETISERTFRDTYIDGADIFMRSDGIYGIPFGADPLVMYWNKDMFSSAGLAQPPKTWETLVSQTVGSIVRTNDALEISQSAVAFGEYGNVAHAKEILSMLFLQSGSNIINENDNQYSVTLNQNSSSGLSPGEAALSFYTQFVTPGKEYYSWNRSKISDRKEFLGGTLAMYFAPASERGDLERDNANLNFDSAKVPQGEGVSTVRNYARFYAFAIPRTAKNIRGSYAVATYLASPAGAQLLVDGFNFAPAHRESYTGNIADPHKSLVYQSALISHGWLDPSPSESNIIFRKAVEDVTSGKVRLNSIMLDTVDELESLF